MREARKLRTFRVVAGRRERDGKRQRDRKRNRDGETQRETESPKDTERDMERREIKTERDRDTKTERPDGPVTLIIDATWDSPSGRRHQARARTGLESSGSPGREALPTGSRQDWVSGGSPVKELGGLLKTQIPPPGLCPAWTSSSQGALTNRAREVVSPQPFSTTDSDTSPGEQDTPGGGGPGPGRWFAHTRAAVPVWRGSCPLSGGWAEAQSREGTDSRPQLAPRGLP